MSHQIMSDATAYLHWVFWTKMRCCHRLIIPESKLLLRLESQVLLSPPPVISKNIGSNFRFRDSAPYLLLFCLFFALLLYQLCCTIFFCVFCCKISNHLIIEFIQASSVRDILLLDKIKF